MDVSKKYINITNNFTQKFIIFELDAINKSEYSLKFSIKTYICLCLCIVMKFNQSHILKLYLTNIFPRNFF